MNFLFKKINHTKWWGKKKQYWLLEVSKNQRKIIAKFAFENSSYRSRQREKKYTLITLDINVKRELRKDSRKSAESVNYYELSSCFL